LIDVSFRSPHQKRLNEIADSNDLVRIQPAGRLVGSVYDPVGMLDGVAGR
jgi:hypothetical protein